MKRWIIGIALLVLLLMYGCAGDEVTGRAVQEMPPDKQMEEGIPTQPTLEPIAEPMPVSPAHLPIEGASGNGMEAMGAAPTISIIDSPESAKEGHNVRIVWGIRSDVPKSATHTAVHYDLLSHAGDFGTKIAPGISGYPFMTQEYIQGAYPVPGKYYTDFRAPFGVKSIYFRAHSIIDGMNYWTDEQMIRIDKEVPMISFIDVPKSVPEGTKISAYWIIDTTIPLTTLNTALLYDTVSHLGAFGEKVDPSLSGYSDLMDGFVYEITTLPKTFSHTIDAPRGAEYAYLRAHTVINGKHYWTDEAKVAIERNVRANTMPSERIFIVEADSNGIYPDTLIVNREDTVNLEFRVRMQDTPADGLEFRSFAWGTTLGIKQGESKVAQFRALQSFNYTSNVPLTNNQVAQAQIIVR